MNRWLEAARPKTLPASVAPVLVGTAASSSARASLATSGEEGGFSLLRFFLAMGVALLLQVAVNFANDYFDGVKGVDTDARTGPRRLVAAGLIDAPQMKRAMLLALGLAGALGLWLSALAGPELLVIGLAAGAATLGYSGGPKPYASAGLGEVFVFVFFGVIATVGSQYVQDERVGTLAVVASLAMGGLATALLVVNNLRDIPQDELVGKRTLAVRLGEQGTRNLYAALILGSFIIPLVLLPLASTGWVALPLLALPLAGPSLRAVSKAPLGPELIPALAGTARLQLIFAVLMVVGLCLRPMESAVSGLGG